MQPALALPPLSEIGLTRDDLLAALGDEKLPPSHVLSAAALHVAEIEDDIIEVIERARTQDLDDASALLLFRGLHILAAHDRTAGYRPCIALLREAGKRAERLLGDAVTETLSKILAGLFDGDAAPLLALISATEVDEFVRNAALKAFGFLTFDGRIDRGFAEDFLHRFERENVAPHDDYAWHGWASVVGLLGFKELSPRVHAACSAGRIPPHAAPEKFYRDLMKDALVRPADASRFDEENLGYIDDVVATLEGHSRADFGDVLRGSDELPHFVGETAHNPHRNVGRNDPCPCGSGKKFKKCCLRDA